MKLVFVTRPAFLDAALPFTREISKKTETHFLLEIEPESIKTNILDLSGFMLKEGIHPANLLFEEIFPSGVRDCWKDTASFNLIIHHNKKSLNPHCWRISRKALCFIKSIKPDVIYFDGISPRMAIALPGMKLPSLFLSIHDSRPHKGEANWRIELSRRITFPHVKKFILHNKSQREEFSSYYNIEQKDIISIPLGCYDIYRQWNVEFDDKKSQMVLFFGRISPYKGIEYFIKAAEIASEYLSNVKFVIAGKTISGFSLPPLPLLQNGCYFELHNEYISIDEQVTFFKQASVVICPYIEATQSGVILTAYAFNKPVIASRVGGLPEYIEENKTGLLVRPNNSRELAEAILSFFKKPISTPWNEMISQYCNSTLSWDTIVNMFLDEVNK